MREKISPIRDERTLSICLCADAIHTSPAYYFLATGGGRRSVADIKPVGDVARDMPVLIPTMFPSELMMGLPPRIEPAAMFVSMIDSDGIDVTTALAVIAETGADMSRFPTAGHFASWLGLCPGTKT